MKEEKLVGTLGKEITALKKELAVKEDMVRNFQEEASNNLVELRRLKKENKTLESELVRVRKELNIRSASDDLNRTTQLEEQNRRLVSENSRLREEINVRDLELAKHGVTSKSMAQYTDSIQTHQSAEQKLQLARAENKRITDELKRLRAALDETHVADTGSRFTDQRVAGQMIERFKDAKERNSKWATKRPNKLRTGEAVQQENETDDTKLLNNATISKQ